MFIDRIGKFKNQAWFSDLERCSKRMEYACLFDVRDGLCRLTLEYRNETLSNSTYCIVLLKFFKWDDEKSEYSSNPTCVLVVDTDSDIHDFESVSKEFLKLKEMTEVITKGYVEFEDLVEKLEGQGVKFGC